MKLPESVRIGPKTYVVTRMNKAETTRGLTYLAEDRMEVREGMSPTSDALVLMHEIVHAIFDAGSWDGARDNEQLVEHLANYFVMLIRDNPVEEIFR